MRQYQKLTFFCLTSTIFGIGISDVAHALGLGDIALNSYLFQPMAAQVQLQSVDKDVDVSSIQVQLASVEAFEKAGLERPFFLTKFQFEVVKDKHDRYIIKISSHEPVSDPFVTFLLEAKWSSGRVIKEYTLLLDPVDFKYAQNKQNFEAVSAQPKLAKATPSISKKTIKVGSGKQYGPTRQDDSLWAISKNLVKNKPIRIQQAMIAVAKKNPSAFMNGNINALRKGAVLELPSEDEMQMLSYEQAKAEVLRHQEALKQNKTIVYPQESVLATNVKINSESSAQVVAQKVPSKEEIQQKPLKLLTPFTQEIGELIKEDPKEKSAKVALAKNNVAVEKLNQRLLMIEEALDTLTESNKSLKETQKTLKSENQQLTMTLQAKELELEILKQQLKEKSSTVAQQVGNAPQSQSVAMQDPVVAPGSDQDGAASATKASFGSNAANVAQVAQPNPVTTSPSSEIKSPVEPSTNTWLYALLVLLLGGGAAAVYVRKNGFNLPEGFSLPEKLSLPEGFSFQDFQLKDLFSKKGHMPIKVATVTEHEETDSSPTFNMSEAFSVFDEQKSNIASSVSVDKIISSNNFPKKHEVEEEKSNKNNLMMEEAERLIVNEQFNTAEILLKEILAEDPHNWIAHGKLCEVYYLSNQKSLLKAYEDNNPQNFKENAPDTWEKLQGFLSELSIKENNKIKAEKSSNIQELKENSISELLEFDLSSENVELKSPPKKAPVSFSDVEEVSIEDISDKLHQIEFEAAVDVSANQYNPMSNNEENIKYESAVGADSTGEADFSEYVDPNQKDENDNKLALAQAYIDLEDMQGAIEHINEVLADGTQEQKIRAKALMDEINNNL